jgi:FAD dependent oxidoreductase TIGR03364
VRHEGLRAGLWSTAELSVDPREVVSRLPGWLTRTFGVVFAFDTTVLRYEPLHLITTKGAWSVPLLAICSGADFRDLAPEASAHSGMIRCKLQMMRSQPYLEGFRLGTHMAAGLTLRHYPCFATCPTLPDLSRRLDAELPEYGRYGIHVLVAQNESGELVIGDSHEYGDTIEPFDKPHLDDLILKYLHTFLTVPDLAIAARWHGVYVKHPTDPFVIARPTPETLAVTGVGGAGMTLSFGLAEQTVNDWLGETHD